MKEWVSDILFHDVILEPRTTESHDYHKRCHTCVNIVAFTTEHDMLPGLLSVKQNIKRNVGQDALIIAHQIEEVNRYEGTSMRINIIYQFKDAHKASPWTASFRATMCFLLCWRPRNKNVGRLIAHLICNQP